MEFSKKTTKADIIDNIYYQMHETARREGRVCEISKDEIHEVLDNFFSDVERSLSKGKVIELRGFGTFEVRERKGRSKARNPKTGEVVSVDAHSVAVFRPGKEIKESVRNSKA